jgi:hypothetical protein
MTAASTAIASTAGRIHHVAPDWLEHEAFDGAAELVVATLGPAGTSSESAANHLIGLLGGKRHRPAQVSLHPSFESAAQAVLERRASVLLVANAYPDVRSFYRDESLRLVGAFIRSTPPYGIAAVPGAPIPFAVRIATHPGPAPLIRELLSPAFLAREIELVSSTRTAAAHVASGRAHLALTNEPSVRRAGLEFVSPTRVILMLWSVFTRAQEVDEG